MEKRHFKQLRNIHFSKQKHTIEIFAVVGVPTDNYINYHYLTDKDVCFTTMQL